MPTVLIVDDHNDSADALAIFLRKRGYSTTHATNGRHALTLITTHTPDAIILDLMMPEMDGPSFLNIIKSYARFRTLPIIVLTGLDHGSHIERIRRLGATTILTKSKGAFSQVASILGRLFPPPHQHFHIPQNASHDAMSDNQTASA